MCLCVFERRGGRVRIPRQVVEEEQEGGEGGIAMDRGEKDEEQRRFSAPVSRATEN